ncbi:MAG: DUF1549 domain-containing protein [Pirellulales bacterium]
MSSCRHRRRLRRISLAKLEPQGRAFPRCRERRPDPARTWICLGFRPEPTEVQAFTGRRLSGRRLRADDRTVLESPHYGERWGRHWLDTAGYVDGKLDNDLGTIYRTTASGAVAITSFRPTTTSFDEFLTEQLAGDELTDWRHAETFDDRTFPADRDGLRSVDDHADFDQYGIDKRYEVVNETLDMFSTAISG